MSHFTRKPLLWTLRNLSNRISLRTPRRLIRADTFHIRGIDLHAFPPNQIEMDNVCRNVFETCYAFYEQCTARSMCTRVEMLHLLSTCAVMYAHTITKVTWKYKVELETVKVVLEIDQSAMYIFYMYFLDSSNLKYISNRNEEIK